jgi:hypothetical protein
LKAIAMSKSTAGNPRSNIMITVCDPEWSGSSSSHLRDPHLWAIHRAEISRTSGSMMTMLAVPCIGPRGQFTSRHTLMICKGVKGMIEMKEILAT